MEKTFRKYGIESCGVDLGFCCLELPIFLSAAKNHMRPWRVIASSCIALC